MTVIICDVADGVLVLCADDTWDTPDGIKDGHQTPRTFASRTHARQWLQTRPLGWYLSVPARPRLLSERLL